MKQIFTMLLFIATSLVVYGQQEIHFDNEEVSPTNTRYSADITVDEPLCDVNHWFDFDVVSYKGIDIETGDEIEVLWIYIDFSNATTTSITIDSFPVEFEGYTFNGISISEECDPEQSGVSNFSQLLPLKIVSERAWLVDNRNSDGLPVIQTELITSQEINTDYISLEVQTLDGNWEEVDRQQTCGTCAGKTYTFSYDNYSHLLTSHQREIYLRHTNTDIDGTKQIFKTHSLEIPQIKMFFQIGNQVAVYANTNGNIHFTDVNGRSLSNMEVVRDRYTMYDIPDYHGIIIAFLSLNNNETQILKLIRQ